MKRTSGDGRVRFRQNGEQAPVKAKVVEVLLTRIEERVADLDRKIDACAVAAVRVGDRCQGSAKRFRLWFCQSVPVLMASDQAAIRADEEAVLGPDEDPTFR